MLAMIKRQRRLVVAAVITAAFFSVVGVALSYAFEESYGHEYKCTNGCYIQSGGAHTFVYNFGKTESGGAPYLACQLFNGSENYVTHGIETCHVTRSNNGAYVTARVYNESGGSGSEKLSGWAHTN
jgi:hypothetical protein